ncbi:MAG TPA: glutamyl-tRNA reductase [Nocardioidaceae bacterium]|nr:glutamyl-tRNA reductase [Nocardioidaceae bacterium]
MSILVVGASHLSAPVDVLERLSVEVAAESKMRAAALALPHVSEAVLLSTCNRVEVYAEVDRFHGGVDEITTLLSDRAGLGIDALTSALYVHYDDGAVGHLYAVACGLRSMVVGEGQVLGQVRRALRGAQDDQSAGPVLNSLFQQALRVGKRVHTETGLDRAGQSVVSLAVEAAAEAMGGLAGKSVCVVGAGSIAGLCAATVRRAGAEDLVVASRTPAHAERLAATHHARSAQLAALSDQLVGADLVLSCTGATGVVVRAAEVASAVGRRAGRPLTIVDLAMPHDVEPAVADLPTVRLIPLGTVTERAAASAVQDDVDAAQRIVAEEVAAFQAARGATAVLPTVLALRSMATSVVAAELGRLWARRAELTDDQRDEIANTLQRVVEKVLHEPTVRVQQLVGQVPDASYAEALAQLFALDPAAVEAVTAAGEQP